MGCDLALAWPSAEIAVMGATGAVEILHRREDDPTRRLELEHEYEERLLNPYIAAERGFIDAVIDPAETRSQLATALDRARHQASDDATGVPTTTCPSETRRTERSPAHGIDPPRTP